MSLFTERTIFARYLERLFQYTGLPPLEADDEGGPQTRRLLEALVTLQKQPEEYLGDLGLLLALKSLPTVQFPKADTALTKLASEAVVLWAETLVDAVRVRTYDNPRLERLHQCSREIRVLDARLVKTGIAILVSVLLDPGEDEDIRCHIARTLGELGRHAPVQAFLTCLHHCPTRLSRTLKDALRTVGDQTPLEPLITELLHKSEHPQVRKQVASLPDRQEKPDVVKALIEAANGNDSLAAYHAIDELALLGECAPLPVLIALLQHENADKRYHAAKALGELGQDGAFPFLIKALSDPKSVLLSETVWFPVRSAAVEALGKLSVDIPSEQLLAWLGDENSSLQLLALEKLAQREQRVPIEPLLAILHDPEKHEIYANALRLCNEQAFPVPVEDLLRLLQEKHWSLHTELVRAFCLPGLDVPVDALLALLTHPEHVVARQALTILEMLRQPIPIELLFTRYEMEDRLNAEWGIALLRMGKQLPAEMLIKIASACAGRAEDDDTLDNEIIEILSKLGKYIVDPLLAKLSEYTIVDAGFVLKVVCRVYEHIPEKKLLAALQKSEGDICMAADILAVAGDDRFLPILLSLFDEETFHPEMRCRILSALAKWKERLPIDVLLNAVQHEDKRMRQTAVRILRELRSVIDMSQVVEPLKRRILAEKDTPKSQEYWYTDDLIEALGLCGEFTPVAFLASLLEDEERDVFNEIAEALGEAGQYVPFEILFTMLGSEDEFVRQGAIAGMGKQKEHVPVPRLLTLLARIEQDEENPWRGMMANSVIDALLELEEYASHEVLEPLLQHENEQVRQGASRALVKVKTRGLQAQLTREWRGQYSTDFVRQSFVEAQVGLGEQAPFDVWIAALDDEKTQQGAASILDGLARIVPTKMVALASTCNRPEMRMARLRAWSMLGQVEEIIAAARADTNMRWTAIEILGELGDPAAIEPLVQLLRESDDSRLLLATIDALGKLGPAVPVEPLLECCGYRNYEGDHWHGDRDPGVEAAEVVKRTHPEVFRALIPLAEAMVCGDLPAGVFASRTQSRIADAIGTGLAGPALLSILEALLDWPYWQVRMKAAEAFGKIRRNIPETAIERLLILLFDPQSRAVRKAADNALAEIISLESGLHESSSQL